MFLEKVATEEHLDQMFILESLINSVAHADESLLDLHVLDALEATRRSFAAELDGRTFRPGRMDPRVHLLFYGLRAVGNLLVGQPTPDLENRMKDPPEPIPVDTLIRLIRRLEKSVKIWNEQGGRQGYLEYIASFLPGDDMRWLHSAPES